MCGNPQGEYGRAAVIIDYAWGKPHIAALKTAGVTGVVRYISHDPSKDLTKPELAALKSGGLSVGLVFETTAKRALGGHGAGVADAKEAKNRLASLGLPNATPVYFAVDFDATDSQKPRIHQYLKGAGSILPEVGVYGGFWVIKYAFEHKSCEWFWQTYAWSGGRLHPASHLYQYSNGHKLGGVSCDYNRAMKPDWGQSGQHSIPRPKPSPVKPILVHYVAKDGSDHFEQVGLPGAAFRWLQFARRKKYHSVGFTRQ